jgi:hypothetical protein
MQSKVVTLEELCHNGLLPAKVSGKLRSQLEKQWLLMEE